MLGEVEAYLRNSCQLNFVKSIARARHDHGIKTRGAACFVLDITVQRHHDRGQNSRYMRRVSPEMGLCIGYATTVGRTVRISSDELQAQQVT